MTRLDLQLGSRGPFTPDWRALSLGLVTCALAVVASLQAADQSLTTLLGALGFSLVCGWLFVTEKYHYALLALMLYVALADGFLRLATGHSELTLVRNLLLFCLVAGVVFRHLLRGGRIVLPPLSGWVLAFVAAALVQLFNPDSGTLLHSLAGLRQHLEWVPLFFFGYAVMRTTKRLRVFMLVLCIVTAVNGVVSYIQFQLPPAELTEWGAGYKERVIGTGDTVSRTFVDSGGVLRNRPTALGSDMGFGGILGLVAVPAAFALIGLRTRHWRYALAAIPLSVGVFVAVATSQARVAVIGAGLGLLAFLLLAAFARRSMTAVMSVLAVAAIAFVVAVQLFEDVDEGLFERYKQINITPSGLITETFAYREDTLELLPKYMADYPLGAGLGSEGPASTQPGGGPNARRLAGETQPSFLLLELGIPGLVIFLGLAGVLLARSLLAIPRLEDPEARILLSALVAGMIALLASGAVGAMTTAPPGAPFFWFAAGTLAYWTARAATADRDRLSSSRLGPISPGHYVAAADSNGDRPVSTPSTR